MPAAAENCGELLHELARQARLLHVMKSRMAGLIPAGLDGAAFGVLMALVKLGPRRQGELAETALLDPSTVSRYVAQLVRTGLVSRRPDPGDGRAVQLVATDEGSSLAREAGARRESLIGTMLADWPPEDASTLVRLLRRLNDEMEARREGGDPLERPAGA
jgi:MarR family transcriptional regulator, lower aerobic nicotinate degradation pathway regulator